MVPYGCWFSIMLSQIDTGMVNFRHSHTLQVLLLGKRLQHHQIIYWFRLFSVETLQSYRLTILYCYSTSILHSDSLASLVVGILVFRYSVDFSCRWHLSQNYLAKASPTRTSFLVYTFEVSRVVGPSRTSFLAKASPSRTLYLETLLGPLVLVRGLSSLRIPFT